MFTENTIKYLPLLVLSGVLSGCAGLGGKDKFSCPGMPDGITCADPITVYEHSDDVDDLAKLRHTEEDEAKARASKEEKGTYDPINDEGGYLSDTPSSSSQSPSNTRPKDKPVPGIETGAEPGTLVKVTSVKHGKKTSAVYQSYINQKQLIVSPDSPKPILQPAEVARIWIAPWTDQNQDLHWAGFVFTEITPRRWSFGESAVGAIQPTLPVLIDSGHKKRYQRNARTGRRYEKGHMNKAAPTTYSYPATPYNHPGATVPPQVSVTTSRGTRQVPMPPPSHNTIDSTKTR